MSEEATNSKTSAFSSKRWLNVYSSKATRGKKHFKNDAALFAKLVSWGDPAAVVSKPFSSRWKKGLRAEIEDAMYSYDRKGIKLSDPISLSYFESLPLSGDRIQLKPQDGDFVLTAAAFDFSEYEFLNLYGDLTQKISNFRNKKDSSDSSPLTYKQLEFFFHATKIAQCFSRQFHRNRAFFDTGKSNEITFKIDRNFIRLLLAVETLQPHVVAQELFTFIQSVVHYLFQLELLFFGLGVKIDELYHLKEIKQASVRLRDSLLFAHSNPVQSDGRIKDKEERETPATEAAQFYKTLTGNQIGLSISSTLPESPNLLRSLNYKDQSLTVNSSEFQVLESWALSLYRKCMYLISAASGEKITSEEEMLVGDDFIFTLLVENLSSTEINPDGYTRVLNRASHLKKTLKQKKQIEIVEQITKLVKTCIDTLQRGDQSQLPALVGCLRNNPSSLDDRLASLESEFDVNAKWKQDIRTFELKIDSRITEEDALGSMLFSIGVEPQELHKELSKSLNPVIKARERYIKLVNSLTTNNNLAASVADKEKNKLKKRQDTYTKEYGEAKDELLKKLSGEGADKRLLLAAFGNRIKTITDSFFDDITRADAEAIITHSNAPGALMIGLGQGGEQIVRATLAKMLNNNTDTRCRNLLKGLNIDIEKLNGLIAKEKDSFDVAIPAGANDTFNEIAEIFDNANLLAINAGPEQKTMLSQPYNYIWGTTGGENTKFDQKKDNFIKQSTNAILLDVGKKGSGGKMGKGRAYAVNAEAAISDAFRQKQEGKNIRQVCVVHSFAGGSGSGMILPVLRMIKQNLPGAMVWVFSAGETAEGSSTHDAENVVYITSDILQARYNALHYKEKEITLKEWDTFKETASTMYKELTEEWKRVSVHLPQLPGDNFEDFQIETRNKLSSQIDYVNSKFEPFFALKKPNAESKDPFEIVADTPELQQQFYRSASNTKSATEVTNIWRTFSALVEDYGSFSLRPLIVRNTEFENIAQEGTAGYATQFSHLKYICLGLKERADSQSEDDARNKINEKYQDKKEIHPYAMYGVEASINYDAEGVDNEFNYDDLEKLLHDYANKMRHYHMLLSNHYENIKLNLAAGDDPNIKHVIISNGHLDLAAKDIVPNRTQNYEIYNSIMMDTFLNLVHSIVENNSNPESDDIANTTTLSNEVMDLNDMSGRTNPTSNATLLSLPEVLSTQNDIHFARDDADIIAEDLAYHVFTKLFEHPLSPLMDSTNEGNYQLPGQGLMALYSDYLRNKQGLRKFKVTDVIHTVQEQDLGELMLTEEDVLPFWDNVTESFTEEQLNLLEVQSKYQINELVNTVNWLRMLNPEIISQIYGGNFDYFMEKTRNWQKSWKLAFDNAETDPNSPVNKGYRFNTISNYVGRICPEMSSPDRKIMSTLLFELGVIDESHLSAIPTSLIYDFAPSMLKKIIKPVVNFTTTYQGVTNLPTPLTEEQIPSYMNPNQIPSYDIANNISYNKWETTRETLIQYEEQDRNFKIHLTLSLENGVDKSLRYLTILTANSDVAGERQNNVFAITPEFMKDLAELKQACVNEFPEFASSTILNRLIVASPTINSRKNKRSLEEKPQFRRAAEDIETNSQPKFLHPNETKSSILFRALLLGNKPQNHRQKVLNDSQIEFSNSSWFSEIQNSADIVYGKLFDTLKFENAVRKRVESLLNSQDNIQKESEFGGSISLNVLNYICDEINSMDYENGKMSTKILFDTLFSKITKSSSTWISSKDGLNQTTLKKHVADILNLLTRLSSMSFAAHRQHRFAVDSASKEYGVAYEFEGTLDAIRSMPEDWLWLVNSSSTVEARLLERTLKFFSLNYLKAPKTPKYKVFVQHLQNGPLAHLTLISQKAGFTEISEKYSQLMNMLARDKFGIIKGPYVHPYSFLRNILWLHTFKNMWVQGPKNTFDRSLGIPESVISSIFAKPHLIEETEGAVMSSGDMKGINLSHYDTEMWRRAKETVYKEITEDDDQHYQERMKNQIHIPDMLLINYLKELCSEDESMENFDDVYKQASRGELEALELIYPSAMWSKKLATLNLNQYIIPSKTMESKDEESLPPLPGMLPPLSKKPQKKSEAWFNALESWIDWYKNE